MTLNKKTLVMILILVGSVFQMGCDSGTQTKSRVGRMVRSGYPPGYNGGYGDPNGIGGEWSGSQWSMIQTSNGSLFSAVQGLISASMDPRELGEISNSGDVGIIGYVERDAAGNVNYQNSRMAIKIWDSYAYDGADPIEIQISRLESASGNGSNGMTLIFADAYGEIIISGQVDQTNFYGQVSYRNSQYFDDSQNPRSGTLGSFRTPICNFFSCRQ